MESGDFDDIGPADLQRLLEIEAIVPADENELETVINRNLSELEDSDTLSFIIQPTANCQLGCDYCGQLHTKKQIDPSFYSNILARIEEKFKIQKYKNLRISWFGSEPLMGWRNIQELTPLLRSLAARHQASYGAAIVTNGLSLKPGIFESLVNEFGIDAIEITLDGSAFWHDKRRHTKEGGATFDLIFRNLLEICALDSFAGRRIPISIRCNVDARNQEGVLPLIRQLAAHGLQRRISFYPCPIHSWGNDAHTLSLTKEAYADLEIGWIIEMAALGFPVTGLIPGLKKSVCIAVTKDAEVIDANGNIFNCTEVPYVPVYENSGYVLGNLRDTPPAGISNPRVFQDWNTKVLTDNNTCSTCRMLPVCGGMCPKSWEENLPACPSNKFNIKDKLVLAYLYTRGMLTTTEEESILVNQEI